MTSEEQMRQENTRLQEQVRTQQELIERQAEQIALLTAQIEDLQARLSKDSHSNSSAGGTLSGGQITKGPARPLIFVSYLIVFSTLNCYA